MFELLKNYIRGFFSTFPKGKKSQGGNDLDNASDSYDAEWDYRENIPNEACSDTDSASDCSDLDSSSSD